MPAPTLAQTPPAPATARLIVHAARAGDASPHALADTFQQLRDWCKLPGSGRKPAKLPLHLQVDDLRGQKLVAIADAGPRVELELPAGTYHVTASLGDICRGYTLTLLPGATFELRLCKALQACG